MVGLTGSRPREMAIARRGIQLSHPGSPLTVSLPGGHRHPRFYIAYRLAEDYLIVPRIMGRTVEVPAVVTVAVLLGGALMGLIGALVAIPAAAALRLLLNEVTFRRLDRS